MKLISMHVDNFGGMHNYDYNFEEGLNVILHDNGWGKTTLAAFLKAMLYGFDAKRSKDVTENERRRYLPWQGGKYGGTLDFEANDVRYRIYRTFGETARFDTTKVTNLDTRTTAKISPDKIGETLFHLDASAFQRSVFINQNGLSITGAANSIHTRLNALVSQVNDAAASEGAITSLTNQIKEYEKIRAKGRLDVINDQIDEKERLRDNLWKMISNQDDDRERISELDDLLNRINKELEEKNSKLDEAFGEEKKREAAREQLEKIKTRISELQDQMDAIRCDLGGNVPSQEEIDQIKRQAQAADGLKIQIKELKDNYTRFTNDYHELLEKYGGSLPQFVQLDTIQNIYGEMQGVLSAAGNEATELQAPKGYETIQTAVKDDPEYIEKLRRNIRSQASIREMIRDTASHDREIQNDATSWNEKKKRYATIKEELDRDQKSVKGQEDYRPEKAEQVIDRLEELQRKQQKVDAKKESVSVGFLTPEQEDDLRSNPGELPDLSEGNEILRTQRDIARREAEIQGMSARLDGEKSKAESLAASLAQLETTVSLDVIVPEAPDQSSGLIMLGAGAVMVVVGVILGVVVMPALFALAAVGACLVILGVVSHNNYKKKRPEYEARKNVAEQNRDAIRRKQELLEQQNAVQTSISDLEKQIAGHETELQKEKENVSVWFAKWGPDGAVVSEAMIDQVLEKAERIQSLREKQKMTASAREFVDEQTKEIEAEREAIDAVYPEFSGMSIQDELSSLRSKLNSYNVAYGQLQTSERTEKRFIEEAGVTRDAFDAPESPNAASLKADRDKTEALLEQKLTEANKVLAVLGLDTNREHVVQALQRADTILRAYEQYDSDLKRQSGRQERNQRQLDGLQRQLEEAMIPISLRYVDMDVPERLTKVREEVSKAAKLQEKIEETKTSLESKNKDCDSANQEVTLFTKKYGHFIAQVNNDILAEIYKKAGKYGELEKSVQQLEEQREEMGTQKATLPEEGSEEAALRSEVQRLKEQREKYLIEYTKKEDSIRLADDALERYPDTVQEIRELYERKQKAQAMVVTWKRAIQLIKQAKENLAKRYLSKVEDLFNSYMHIWLNNDEIKGLLDIDFNIMIEENGKTHVAEGYSTGYCDLIDFCMRLALVDTLFENEQPFLILDDPFVNLDADRLEKALELLNVMAANKQVIYFICHPIRAIETEENAASREEFLKLAEATRQAIKEHQTTRKVTKKIERKSPRELYKVKRPSAVLPFIPANLDYVITNNIFSMNFVLNKDGIVRDSIYELFFIDSVGHVLNDRQMLEISNGKLSSERVQFSLNTRDDSGSRFELMIRESGQDDYDVIARIPFRAKLAFAGTFNFDF